MSSQRSKDLNKQYRSFYKTAGSTTDEAGDYTSGTGRWIVYSNGPKPADYKITRRLPATWISSNKGGKHADYVSSGLPNLSTLILPGGDWFSAPRTHSDISRKLASTITGELAHRLMCGEGLSYEIGADRAWLLLVTGRTGVACRGLGGSATVRGYKI